MVTFTVPKPQPVLRPGTYNAILAGLERRENGDRAYILWTFEIATKTGSVTVKATSSTSFGVKAKARVWVEALLGRALEVGESVDTDDLLGQRCLVVVGQRQRDDGTTVNTIEHVLPAPSDESEEPF